MRIALAVLITGLAFAAQADGIYKWVDENGVVHFGSQPPQQKQVEVVKAPKSERYKQWRAEQQAAVAQQQAEAAAKEPKAEAEPAAQAKAEPAQQPQAQTEPSQAELAVRAQRCQQAQSNLQELQSHARVREMDEQGNMRVLGEDERQERIARAQQAIQDNC